MGFYSVQVGKPVLPYKVLVLGDSIVDQHRWVERMSFNLSDHINQSVITKMQGHQASIPVLNSRCIEIRD